MALTICSVQHIIEAGLGFGLGKVLKAEAHLGLGTTLNPKKAPTIILHGRTVKTISIQYPMQCSEALECTIIVNFKCLKQA
jgi:hypothetical protein